MNSISHFIPLFKSQSSRPEMLQYESEKLLDGQNDNAADEFIDIERLRPRPRRLTTFLTWIWRIAISCLCAWALFNLSLTTWNFFHRNSHSQLQLPKKSCSCGNSVADALSMGCKYDALASAWLPPACIDEELSYEFDHAGPEADGSWVYYTDYDKTGTYSLEEVSRLADTGTYYYNTMAWHLAHCTFNWRKAVRSKWTGVTLEYRSDTEEHVKHCEMMFKDRTPLDYVGTVSIVTTNADWHEMHPEMHPAMHPDNKMHPDHSMHPENQMHPNMHPAMHPDNKMHPEMHPAMHPDSKMHPDSELHSEMHPGNNMHPDMHPNMHPEMHPDSKMHPDMHPNMHPEMHPNMHPDMHPNMHPNMHPETHPNMHPEMHPEMLPNMHPNMHPTTY